eukprot:5235271-Prymnesium_polylepis.1
MLALTAIHDIMKLEHLCPTVLPEHAPYHGLVTGDVIRDHDLALGYVLSHDPLALPCFAALSEGQQNAVRFTQADLSFNHGWLVQAEAPPGALFAQFKRMLSSGAARAQDIAFYVRAPRPNRQPCASPLLPAPHCQLMATYRFCAT